MPKKMRFPHKFKTSGDMHICRIFPRYFIYEKKNGNDQIQHGKLNLVNAIRK